MTEKALLNTHVTDWLKCEKCVTITAVIPGQTDTNYYLEIKIVGQKSGSNTLPVLMPKF